MSQSFWAATVERSLVILLLFVVFVASIFIAGASLHDPDTCWLLALGKQIVEGGRLPSSDPYSYTMSLLADRVFILYQWLTEVLFFLSYKALNLSGLLLMVAIVLTAAFVSIPLALARKIGMPGAIAIVGTILTLLTAFFHFLARPEIFSYLLLSIYISMTHFFLRGRTLEKIDWKAVIVFGALMAVWCNLHSGFVLGLLYLGVFSAVTSIADYIKEKKRSPINNTIRLSFIAAFLATLINPYGVGLWKYLPELFFMPMNKFILELAPVGGKDLLEWTLYPFFILVVVSALVSRQALAAKIDLPAASSPRGQVAFAVLNFVCWATAGFLCRRIIPFGAVCMFAETGYLLALLHASSSSESNSFWSEVNRRLNNTYRPEGLMWFVSIAVLACLGVYFVSSKIPEAVSLPQSSGVMKAPIDAVRYLEKEPAWGNLFNDPQFGDVMIWNMTNPPKLFIDTRFDMYGKKICGDYRTLYATQDGWQDLMQQYDIAWVFVRPDAPIASRLRSEQDWKVVFADKSSIILQKQNKR